LGKETEENMTVAQRVALFMMNDVAAAARKAMESETDLFTGENRGVRSRVTERRDVYIYVASAEATCAGICE
jgi:hypothetical protein